MSSRKRKVPSVPPMPAPLVLKLEPNAQLQVKLIAPERKPAKLSPWRLRLFLTFTFLPVALLFFIWYNYVAKRQYPSPIKIPPLSIDLAHPAYAVFGDEAELDVTVANHDSIPITGTVTVVFSGGILARPVPSEITAIKFDSLAGGASLTQRIRFVLPQTVTFFSEDSVGMRLQIAMGNRHFYLPNVFRIAIAPLPYIETIISGLIIMIGSGLVAAIAPSLLDIFQKRFASSEAK